MKKNLSFLFAIFFAVVYYGQTHDSGSGIFSVPANVTHVNAAAWGGGGGGGGSNGNRSGGNGGGGGGAASSQIAVGAGNIFTYAVGTAGSAGAASGGTGGNGGNSTITPPTPATNLTGNGGTGGRGNANITLSPGGAASGGTNSPGSGGAQGGNPGGNGGNSGTAFGILGIGGIGNSNVAGDPGGQPGAGGGGGERANNGNNRDKAGGAGAPGRVWFDFITVSAVTPSPACIGSTITIAGTNFSNSGTTTVTVNGVACTNVTFVNATTMTAVIASGTPVGLGTVDINNNGRRNNGKSITVNPSIAAIGGGAAFVCVGSVTPAFTNATVGGTWSIVNGTGTASISAGGVVTGLTAGTVTVVYTKGCAVTQSLTIAPIVTAIAGTPNPANAATGVCYSGIAPLTSVSWGSVAGATSYDVYFGAGSLPGIANSNVTTTSYSTGTLLPNTTYHWKIVPKNNCGPTSGSPITWSFTTSAIPCYCKPTISTQNTLYINSFQFVGTLNDNPSPNISGASGYVDYTNLTPVVQQAQGAVMNIVASALDESDKPKPGYWKAWVDYDKNGIFSAAEQVYSLTSFNTESLTFGFIIPSSTPVGKYRFRIRVGDNKTFDACTNLTSGETEDYIFEVTADCSAKVNTASLNDVQRCGTGPVTLTASSMETGSGTGIRWYAAASGGSPLFDGADFTTTVTENTSTTYYVVAYNSTCGESVFRIPVTAFANPGPTVDFGTVPSFCTASTAGQVITASNGKRTDILLNEHFDSGLGLFAQTPTESGYLDRSATYWENRPSPYIPRATTDIPAGLYEGLAPALSSGYTGGNFAITNTDYNRAGKLLNRLELKDSEALDTNFFENLTLEFDLYYFTLITADIDPNLINYFSVDYSLNGTTWVNLQTIKTNQGNPNVWKKMKFTTILDSDPENDLPSEVLNATSLKIRFSSYSYGASGLFKESIAALDNVKIYGIKDENSQFAWSSPLAGILYESNCTTPLGSTKAQSICIKPTDTQIENNVEFSITASASFSNGCPAVGTLIVKNNAKIYNTNASTDWNTATNWKPDNVLPDLTKCVIIKKPTIINSSVKGLAKNITIESGGTLNINGSLTLVDAIVNNAAMTDVVVSSDGNLVQNNDLAVNTGPITVNRISPMKKNNYTYWSSPVSGQNLWNFSSGTSHSRFYIYNEGDNKFYTTGLNASSVFTPGKGYAIMAPTGYTTTATTDFPGKFVGVPTNGTKKADTSPLEFPLQLTPITPNRGFNMIGNPYPSNIDFEVLYALNSTKIYNTAYFWTNVDPNRPSSTNGNGDAYTGNAYAIYNGTGGVPATTSGPGTGDGGTSETPTQFIKVGQGFIVKAKQSGQLIFNNSIRNAVGSSNFMSKGASSDKDRFWLKLTTPAQNVNTILIGYIAGATNDFERDYDAPLMSVASDSFYSILNENKLGIQGKTYPLNTSDVVPLGTKHFENGNYTVSLGDKEGIFANGQSIYLKDNQTGIITNLIQGSYTFAAIAGENTARFEIIYQPGAVLATDAVSKEEIVVYRDGEDFVVKSQAKKITALEVYDAAGRLVLQLSPNQKEVRIAATAFVNGAYLLKINRNGEVSSKKILK